MKKHYYVEIALLLLLSVAAASLAADHHFYELVWEYTGLDKQRIDNSVALVRLFGFGSIIILSILNIWKHLHSERKMVESLLASIHKVFFKNVNLTDSHQYSIHRITCHKHYRFSWLRTCIGYAAYVIAFVVLGTSLTHNISSVSSVWLWIIAFSFITLAFYLMLKVIDAWWYQFWLRILKIRWRRNKWNRFLRPGRNYCLSYVRYGYETGELNRTNTTLSFAVDKAPRSSRLFTGKVYDADEEVVISTNHNFINDLIRKFNDKRKTNQMSYDAENDSFRTLLNHPVSVNIEKIGELQSFQTSLTSAEQRRITDFMKSTNTLAFDLFDINNIRHCEHFLGFKIRRTKNATPWGVVVIDVLANNSKTFFEYLGFEEDMKWLRLFLSSYSELFSQAISPDVEKQRD